MATAIVAFAGTLTVKAAVIKIGLQVALTAGLGAYQRRQQKNELRSLQAVQGQNITVEGGSEVAPVIYGESSVGGVVAYANSITERPGSDGIYDLHQCIAHSYRRGGIDSIVGFYLNDAYLRYPQDFDSDGGPSRVFTGADPNWSLRLPSANPQAGVPGIKAVRVQVLTGAPDQTAPTPLVNASPEITTAYVGRDIGWSYWRFRLTTQSSDLFNGGPPNVRAVVRGAKVYNATLDGTRTMADDGFVGNGSHRVDDQSTWAWSDNPAWCIADYLMSYVGLAADRIDWLSFHLASIACAANVSVPGMSEARWRCDVVLSLFERHDANLQALLDTCDGTLTRVSGRWALDVGGIEESVLTITPDDIIGQAVWHSNTPLAQRTNIVGGQYRSRNHDWQDLDIPDRRGFELRRRDGRDIREDLALPGVSRGTQAQRLAERRLRRQDAQQRIELQMTWRAFRLQVGTRFDLDLPLFDSPRKFRVTEMSVGSDQAPVTVTAIEEPDTVWDDMAANEYHREDADGRITRATSIGTADIWALDSGGRTLHMAEIRGGRVRGQFIVGSVTPPIPTGTDENPADVAAVVTRSRFPAGRPTPAGIVEGEKTLAVYYGRIHQRPVSRRRYETRRAVINMRNAARTPEPTLPFADEGYIPIIGACRAFTALNNVMSWQDYWLTWLFEISPTFRNEGHLYRFVGQSTAIRAPREWLGNVQGISRESIPTALFAHPEARDSSGRSLRDALYIATNAGDIRRIQSTTQGFNTSVLETVTVTGLPAGVSSAASNGEHVFVVAGDKLYVGSGGLLAFDFEEIRGHWSGGFPTIAIDRQSRP